MLAFDANEFIIPKEVVTAFSIESDDKPIVFSCINDPQQSGWWNNVRQNRNSNLLKLNAIFVDRITENKLSNF